jgi:hypothetical protein
VATELAVCAVANHPQPPGVVSEHCTVHVTPPGFKSFATTTVTGTDPVLTSEPGKVEVNESEGDGGGPCVMVVVVAAEFEGVVAAEAAMILTALPVGTAAGAV